MSRVISCYLNVRPVAKRNTNGMEHRYRAEWIVRGTTTVVYKSKPCDTVEQATALARAWLEARNRPVSRMAGGLVFGEQPAVTYVDTTDER